MVHSSSRIAPHSFHDKVSAVTLFSFLRFESCTNIHSMGSILRQVCLTSDLVNPRHAILLSTDHFVVSFSDFICIIDADGKRCNQTRQTNNSTVSTGNNIAFIGTIESKVSQYQSQWEFPFWDCKIPAEVDTIAVLRNNFSIDWPSTIVDQS